MIFNSKEFLFAFLPICYFVFWSLRTKNSRYVFLTISGYVFYSCWDYRFCALMAFSTLVSYTAGLGFLAFREGSRRRLCLVVPIVIDLSLLGFFKYAGFALKTSGRLAHWLGLDLDPPMLSIILPVGISFYTFHTITYIIDSYRGVIRPTRNFFEFACYVSFFPQLVAGPIVRFRQVESDLENLDHAERRSGLDIGWSYFAIGMIKKVLIADTIALLIDPPLKDYTNLSTISVWLCVIGYTYQLYFDFSGYSDMAVGLGHMFGVRLPQNFNSPYCALDLSDFWRRWHISLSTCLRDYLYIPLGGSRGAPWHTYANLMITMLLGGLWHGANTTFVVWGAYHGLLLCAYRAGGLYWDRLPRLLRQILTFLLVVVGWTFFRAEGLRMALRLLRKMFVWTEGSLLTWAPSLTVLLLAAAFVAHRMPNSFEVDHEWRTPAVVGFTCLFALCLAVMYSAPQSPFLYFQF